MKSHFLNIYSKISYRNLMLTLFVNLHNDTLKFNDVSPLSFQQIFYQISSKHIWNLKNSCYSYYMR